MYANTIADVYGFIALRTGGDHALAEDITAETYAAAVRHFNAGRATEVTLSWLRTVARRRLIDHWRHQNAAAPKLALLVDRAVGPEVDPRRDHVVAALAALSAPQRTALVLQHVEGYSVAEVAGVLGRSEKATESLLGRARNAFRARYREGSSP